MDGKTPGQAAYEAWQDVLMRSVPQIQAIPWDDLTEDAHVWWADEERRINELSALIAEREPLAVRSSDDVKPEIMQLRRVLTEMQWAVLELMGHRQAIGRVSEATLFGRAMVQVDRIDTEPEATQYYGPESVYCLTPVSEDQARLLAKSRYKTHIVPPALTAALEDGDGEEDYPDGGVWGFAESDAVGDDHLNGEEG